MTASCLPAPESNFRLTSSRRRHRLSDSSDTSAFGLSSNDNVDAQSKSKRHGASRPVRSHNPSGTAQAVRSVAQAVRSSASHPVQRKPSGPSRPVNQTLLHRRQRCVVVRFVGDLWNQFRVSDFAIGTNDDHGTTKQAFQRPIGQRHPVRITKAIASEC